MSQEDLQELLSSGALEEAQATGNTGLLLTLLAASFAEVTNNPDLVPNEEETLFPQLEGEELSPEEAERKRLENEGQVRIC